MEHYVDFDNLLCDYELLDLATRSAALLCIV